MRSSAALSWFARHEIRLAWREGMAMMTAGRRFHKRSTVIWLVVFAALMHLAAYAVIGRFADLDRALDKPTSSPPALSWAGP
jgi:ABC-2 type transport system permease protein